DPVRSAFGRCFSCASLRLLCAAWHGSRGVVFVRIQSWTPLRTGYRDAATLSTPGAGAGRCPSNHRAGPTRGNYRSRVGLLEAQSPLQCPRPEAGLRAGSSISRLVLPVQAASSAGLTLHLFGSRSRGGEEGWRQFRLSPLRL